MQAETTQNRVTSLHDEKADQPAEPGFLSIIETGKQEHEQDVDKSAFSPSSGKGRALHLD